MGINTGYCTVGNFGSELRLDYTVLGSPVNLAARLQQMAPADTILVSESTYNLIRGHVECETFEEITPKGFARPIQVFRANDFISEDHRDKRRRLSKVGEHVEVNVFNSSNVRAAMAELRSIQKDFEQQLKDS